MAIVTSKELYKHCLNESWAVGGFIGYNLEIMQAAIQAGVDEQAPIMVQASCRVIDYAGADRLYAMAQAFSESYQVPIILHLDHGDTVERCLECIDRGFSSVMLDCTDDSYEDNVRKTSEVVRYAHAHGAVVEGEVFHPIPGEEKYSTTPEEALRYAEATPMGLILDTARNCIWSRLRLSTKCYRTCHWYFMRLQYLTRSLLSVQTALRLTVSNHITSFFQTFRAAFVLEYAR